MLSKVFILALCAAAVEETAADSRRHHHHHHHHKHHKAVIATPPVAEVAAGASTVTFASAATGNGAPAAPRSEVSSNGAAEAAPVTIAAAATGQVASPAATAEMVSSDKDLAVVPNSIEAMVLPRSVASGATGMVVESPMPAAVGLHNAAAWTPRDKNTTANATTSATNFSNGTAGNATVKASESLDADSRQIKQKFTALFASWPKQAQVMNQAHSLLRKTQKAIDQQQVQVTRLREREQGEDTEFSALETRDSAQKEEISQLKANLTAGGQELSKLETHVSHKTEKIRKMTHKVHKLENQLEDARRSSDALAKQNIDLEKSVATMTSDLRRIEEENRQLEQDAVADKAESQQTKK
mmetsp:Transcript_7156/g.16991  ORF Transcript_7156/g.16991 Transcript_7156/m.16991 type:complete len:356 (+) Transcript_7156:1-1068(+)